MCNPVPDYDESGGAAKATGTPPNSATTPTGNAAAPHTPTPANQKAHGAQQDGITGATAVAPTAGQKRRDLAAAKLDEQQRKHDEARSQEEKRRQIKTIIDRIPVAKGDLFNFKLDWAEIDNALMEKKIRPWINKKIIEYIGEPEPTLVDFICSKVMAGSTPQGILDDVQMVRCS